MTRAAQWATICDPELLAVRARHAARLDAERARITSAKQAVADAAIVDQREQRVLASRARSIVRELVDA